MIQQHDGVVVDAGRHSSRASPRLRGRDVTGGDGGLLTLIFGASLSLSNTSSSSIVLSEALPEYCSSITTTPSCCCWSHLPQPLFPSCWIKKKETLR